MLKCFPHRQKINMKLYNIQEETIVNDVAQNIDWTYATLDNRHAGHRALVIKWNLWLPSNLFQF